MKKNKNLFAILFFHYDQFQSLCSVHLCTKLYIFFIVSALKAVRHTTLYNCCPNPYYTIEYTVHLVRRAKFYLFNLVIPGVLIAMLTVFSFFLPPLSGERTGLILTNFLSLSVYILMVSENVPPSSNIPLLVT